MNFSIIVPVYNRSAEVDELLESLCEQDYPHFEVIIVEDGSEKPCKEIIDKYTDRISIQYFTKKNSGPGLTRNFGADKAKNDYLIFFDSDCIIPPTYMRNVSRFLKRDYTDAYGGPDMAHSSFTTLQKAINYSMTSFLTTGGIRGGNKSMEHFKPRSFNMGYSKDVYQALGGFSGMRFGEDIDMSLRIAKGGYSTALVREAGVYHKRRTDFGKFYKQVYNSGVARINLFIKYPKSLKIVHLLPTVFTIGILVSLLAGVFSFFFLAVPVLLCFVFLLDALRVTKDMQVAVLAPIASFIQLMGYGIGFMHAVWMRLIVKSEEFSAFERNFYE